MLAGLLSEESPFLKADLVNLPPSGEILVVHPVFQTNDCGSTIFLPGASHSFTTVSLGLTVVRERDLERLSSRIGDLPFPLELAGGKTRERLSVLCSRPNRSVLAGS